MINILIESVKKNNNFFKSKWTILIIVLILIAGLYWFFHRSNNTYQFVKVIKGSITETVAVTGNTTPIESVSLGFQNSGTITRVNYPLGAHVNAGDIIATLDTGDLSAQVAQAQANVDAQIARLNGLKAGAQPEDIAVSQANLKKAQQDLANIYSGIMNTSNSSYSATNDAVRTQLSSFFTSPESTSPQLYFQDGSQNSIDAGTLRFSTSTALNSWNKELNSVDTSSTDSLNKFVQNEISYIKVAQNLLNKISLSLNNSFILSQATLDTYKTNVTVANNEINIAVTNLNSVLQNIASQNSVIAQLQAQLYLKKAGAIQSDISAQEAQVAQAQASVQSAKSRLYDSEIVAPIGGIITLQNAKIGQVSLPGASLVSIISDGRFEVDAQIPETDIGKISIGDVVKMTFDAFPNENFTGKIFYINQAETITQGVVDYQVKVSFDSPDKRIKSGLTANLDIATKKDDNALILPQYAVLVNDKGSFIETLSASKQVITTPVTLGIQDENGNVEILNGVTEGEQVLNIGLKPIGQ